MIRIVLFVILTCVWINAQALVTQSGNLDVAYKDIDLLDSGVMVNVSSDSYITFNSLNLSREQACGLMFKLSFSESFSKPAIFDFYWRTKSSGFSEADKGFFILNYLPEESSRSYVLPLCKLYNYSGGLNNPEKQANITGFRLDFPANKKLHVSLTDVSFLDSQALAKYLTESSESTVVIEPYERVSGSSFTTLDVVLPKLFFALEHGLDRLKKDLGFLIFWLFSLLLLIALVIRSFVQEYSPPKQDS
jgi:hypothetical protein